MDIFAMARGASLFERGQGLVRQAARAEWARNCDLLLDRYNDNGESVKSMRERLKKLYPNNANAMLENLLTLNLARKVVDTKAKLYRRKPRRVLIGRDGKALPDNHPARHAYRRLIGETRLNAKMKWLVRLQELLNSALLWGQIDWRTRRPNLTVLPPHHIIVEQGDEDPTEIQGASAIYVPVGGAPDSPLGEGKPIGYVRYRKVENSGGAASIHVDKLDADFVPLPEQPPEFRAYRALQSYPFVLVRKGEPIGSEMFPDIPHGLLNAANYIDHELTRGALNSRMTDFPAYVYNGTADELGSANPATGAGAIICLGDDDKDLKRLPIDPREEERNRNLLFFLKMFAQINDITPSAFTFDVELLSGTAKFHDKQPEIEYREDLIDMFVPIEEEEIWPMLRDLASLAGFEAASSFSRLRMNIEFPEQVIPLSREEELKNLEREIALGLRSASEIVAENQGITLDEARAKVRENINQLKGPVPDSPRGDGEPHEK